MLPADWQAWDGSVAGNPEGSREATGDDPVTGLRPWGATAEIGSEDSSGDPDGVGIDLLVGLGTLNPPQEEPAWVPRVEICEPCPVSVNPETWSLFDWPQESGDFIDDLWICILPDVPVRCWNDDPLSAYQAFLKENPQWEAEHGAGGIQLQVITPSAHQPWIELSTPGAAQAFDAWFERHVMAVRGAYASAPGGDESLESPRDSGREMDHSEREQAQGSGSSAEAPSLADRPATLAAPGSSGRPDPPPPSATDTDPLAVAWSGRWATQEPAGFSLEAPRAPGQPPAAAAPPADRSLKVFGSRPPAETRAAIAPDLIALDHPATVAIDRQLTAAPLAAAAWASRTPGATLLDSADATAWLQVRQQKLIALPSWLLRPLRLVS
ncbi:MAG: hypothetical protein ACKOCM_06300 [Cyanobacteriota bacterium]